MTTYEPGTVAVATVRGVPNGRGAVVEDEDGARWWRLPGRGPWMHYDEPNRSTRARDWDEITAVKVLSAGVSDE